MKFAARVFVSLHPAVLDPAGTAVGQAINQLQLSQVESVRLGKYLEISLEAEDQAAATAELKQICEQVLTNPVIEQYRFELQAS
ncbi:MAG: phosphoribosylformylglycinamidine synthase subunit PurS [Pseudanabaenaceae cyanobacterium bins.68]|nr:phosphoribosylformylglycinamidine synthase subunit PurS [Pseudanabaenaceae cyanobacterium bins.68]